MTRARLSPRHKLSREEFDKAVAILRAQPACTFPKCRARKTAGLVADIIGACYPVCKRHQKEIFG